MEGMERISFEIISNVGIARSCYIEAIRAAKAGNYEEAEAKLAEGDKNFQEGHASHMRLLQLEGKEDIGLLVIHAEDQLMSAETFKLLAIEFIDIHKKIDGKN